MSMLIVETTTNTIEDALNQVKQDLGFDWHDQGEGKGYFLLGSGSQLRIEFDEEFQLITKAEIGLPGKIVDISDSSASADMYASCMESAVQIVELIRLLLGSGSDA